MDLSNAADTLKRMAEQYRGMVEAAEALGTLGSLQQAISEAQSSIAQSNKDRDEALQYVAKAREEAANVAQDAIRQVTEHNLALDELTAIAEKRAAQMIDNANAQMAINQAAFTSSMAASKDALNTEINALTQKRDALLDDVASLTDKATAATATATAAETKLASVKAMISKMGAL